MFLWNGQSHILPIKVTSTKYLWNTTGVYVAGMVFHLSWMNGYKTALLQSLHRNNSFQLWSSFRTESGKTVKNSRKQLNTDSPNSYREKKRPPSFGCSTVKVCASEENFKDWRLFVNHKYSGTLFSVFPWISCAAMTWNCWLKEFQSSLHQRRHKGARSSSSPASVAATCDMACCLRGPWRPAAGWSGGLSNPPTCPHVSSPSSSETTIDQKAGININSH